MMGKKVISPIQHGFTMIELIAAMVIVGVAVVMAGVSFMSFGHIGKGINARNAQLAQQRLELILAEKIMTGFPTSIDCQDVSTSECGPDPCTLYSGLVDICKDSVTSEFKRVKDNIQSNGCRKDDEFEYCEVTVMVTLDGHEYEYYMRLYNYE